MRKRWVRFAAPMMVLALLAACSGGGGSAEEEESGDGAVTLTTFVSVPPRIEDISTNEVTKYIEQKLNIRFKFDAAPSANAEDKKKLMMASGDYPAVFLSGNFTQAEQIEYGQQGILKPLNDLIEQYGVEIKRAFAEDSELKAAITAPDGNIYALPHVNECFHCWYSQKLWINKGWLDKLGLKLPTTTEEYYEVLKAFKTGDPNGNGQQDEIPLTGAFNTWHAIPANFLMNSFIYNNDENFFIMENGKVKLAANQPEWRDGLAYINRLYSEGLIDKEAFTQNGDQLQQLGNRDGDNLIGSVTAGHIGMAFSIAEGETRHKDYVTVPPLTGPKGVAYAGFYKSYGNGNFAITNKASEAEAIAAIKLADYLYSEEHAIMNEYGFEGKYYEKAKPGELDVHGNPAKYTVKPEYASIGTTLNDIWDQMGITRRTRAIRESWTAPDDPFSPTGYEYRLFMETANHYEGREPEETFPLSIFMDAADAKEANQLRTQINDYIRSNLAQFVTGSRQLTDAEWDSYVKGLDGLKLDRYLEIYQNAYDQLNK
ncbi:sugar ABC transporter substrate-binding protein [Paenibacillus cisolokensis]|uniref:Sugar ABC transporter substrate-binding protein n=1 Tax=Paenibacillus cisolokensis TaxID=1658519 RepID=A0ABQ4N546_9BACL|nr:ABC transporter substrate-binding protein [Paenibacillus cisolokensis]GIQ63296.1 sugar ABC transporter substrate-binding protein [Paenibacillus cisolokensis]